MVKQCRKIGIVLLIGLCLGGCKKNVAGLLEVQRPPVYSYQKEEVMIVVATERNRYSQMYGEPIWQTVLEQGQTFEEYLIDQIQLFMQDLKVMNLLAQEQGIIISEEEQKQIEELAKTYYQGLSDQDKDYIGCDLGDVENLYQEYLLANKAVEKMTQEIDLEISDNEAKVIHISQIVLDDEAVANEVYEQLQAEDADFEMLAGKYSMDRQINRQLGRGQTEAEYEQAAFSLAKGEVSPIVRQRDQYYIIKCTEDYDQQATQKRKEELHTAKKNLLFRKLYEHYVQNNPVEFKNDIWDKIDCRTDYQTTTTNFFELYLEEFGG